MRPPMLPTSVDRRDGMLVLRAVHRTRVLSTSEGAFGRVTYPEVMEALRRMDRPEDFWDIVFQLLDMKLLELLPAARGDYKFQVADVQEHDVGVFLHQNRSELDGYKVIHHDEGLLTRTYLEGLEEAKARAVFL
jgi:hypothetical protein